MRCDAQCQCSTVLEYSNFRIQVLRGTVWACRLADKSPCVELKVVMG